MQRHTESSKQEYSCTGVFYLLAGVRAASQSQPLPRHSFTLGKKRIQIKFFFAVFSIFWKFFQMLFNFMPCLVLHELPAHARRRSGQCRVPDKLPYIFAKKKSICVCKYIYIYTYIGVDTEHIQTQPHAHCLVWKLFWFNYWNTPESVKIGTDRPRVVLSVTSDESPTLGSVRRWVLHSVKHTLWWGVRKWYA